jgi:Protein of unknown function (DUF4242)
VWVATLSTARVSTDTRSVATFLVETYLSRERAAEVEQQAANLERVIEAIVATRARARPNLRHVRSYFVPDDETCFHVIEAPSADVAAEVARRAGLIVDRVVEASSAG